jgi:hypothetical protein
MSVDGVKLQFFAVAPGKLLQIFLPKLEEAWTVHPVQPALTSMRERVRLINGTISIESKPMGGTTIHVRVPIESEQETQRAAG